jgi:hypothetical protein
LHNLCTQLLIKQDNKSILDKIKNNEFIKTIANKYMNRKLIKSEDQTKLPNINFLPSGNEFYHRDLQLQKSLKIIIYLSTVGKDNGPLKIIYPEPAVNLTWYHDGTNARTTPEEIAQHIPPENIIAFEGSVYTMILFEGAVLHCGGYVQRGSRRILYLE